MASVDIVARTRQAESGKPALLIWSWIGIAIIAFQVFVLGRWISGPYFVPTDPGPSIVPEYTRWVGIAAQIAAVIFGAAFIWLVSIRDRVRTGHWSTSALIGLCWLGMWFWDPLMNYSSTHILYNSHLINFGSWTMGSTPGWISPNGNLLPEPLLVIIPGYPLLCYGQILIALWILRRAKQKWSGLSKLSMVGIAFLAMFVTCATVETTLIQSDLYVYPGAIREITLFAGSQKQFPLSQAFFFGGLAQTSILLLLLYRDDKGRSFVERGLEKLQFTQARASFTRFLALYGYSHLMLFALWVIPMQWLGLNSDPYPAGYPSYLINNMCVYGVNRDQCPGPGVMIPRPG